MQTRMNMKEAAEYLHLRADELERLVHDGEVPFLQCGARVMFLRQEIDSWASQRILGFSNQRLGDYHRRSTARAHDLSPEYALMPELVKLPWVEPDLPSKTKPSVLRDLVERAGRTGLLIYPEELTNRLKEREQMCSTALAGGVAMPHPPHHDPYLFEDSFIVPARCLRPIPFGAPDGHTTDLFFLVCCQDERLHLHVLARLCMLCYKTDLLMRIREAEDAPAILDAIYGAEQELLAKTKSS